MIEKPHTLPAKPHLYLRVGYKVHMVGVGIAGESSHPPGVWGCVLLGGCGLKELGDGLEHYDTEGGVCLGPGVRRAH